MDVKKQRKLAMNITIITPYPNPEDRHAKNTGVGSYSTYLAEALEKSGKKVKIYAQIDIAGRDYTNGHISVERVWKKTFWGLLSLLKKIWNDENKVIHIQHELNMFGQEALLPFTPLIPLVARLSGARVITTFHGGTGIKCIDREFVIENGKKLPPWIIRIAFRYIFWLFALFSHQIIVHEDFQKQELIDEHYIPEAKITVIPHGVPESPEIIENAREKLNIPINRKVFLYMGFAARYKGLPELFLAYKKYRQIHPNILLVIGAWMAPRLENDSDYIKWYEALMHDFLSLDDWVLWIWFIDGKDISLYYSIADVLLFPYSRRLAASGPMALAIGYGKDIVLSSILQGEKTFSFDFDDKIHTEEMKKERVWGVVGKRTFEVYQK